MRPAGSAGAMSRVTTTMVTELAEAGFLPLTPA
jgi:hypothetical protein